MPRIKPYSIGFLPEKIREIDDAARSNGHSRSQYVNYAVDQLIRGQFMSNSKQGVVPDKDVSNHTTPSNSLGARGGYPGSTSRPGVKVHPNKLGGKK